jgi:hypothetical protein
MNQQFSPFALFDLGLGGDLAIKFHKAGTALSRPPEARLYGGWPHQPVTGCSPQGVCTPGHCSVRPGRAGKQGWPLAR